MQRVEQPLRRIQAHQNQLVGAGLLQSRSLHHGRCHPVAAKECNRPRVPPHWQRVLEKLGYWNGVQEGGKIWRKHGRSFRLKSSSVRAKGASECRWSSESESDRSDLLHRARKLPELRRSRRRKVQQIQKGLLFHHGQLLRRVSSPSMQGLIELKAKLSRG